jgi:hypothetical protein
MGKKAGNFAPDANANRFRKEAGKREKYEHKKIGTQAAGRMADSQDTEGGLDVLKKAVIGFALFAAAAGLLYVILDILVGGELPEGAVVDAAAEAAAAAAVAAAVAAGAAGTSEPAL